MRRPRRLLHLSPRAGRGRIPSGALAERRNPGEGGSASLSLSKRPLTRLASRKCARKSTPDQVRGRLSPRTRGEVERVAPPRALEWQVRRAREPWNAPPYARAERDIATSRHPSSPIVSAKPGSRGRRINRAAYHPPHLRIRKEQIVVDNAPACLGSIDHAHPEPLDGSLLGGADPRHPTSDSSRQRQRAVVRRGDDGDLAGERTDAVDRR